MSGDYWQRRRDFEKSGLIADKEAMTEAVTLDIPANWDPWASILPRSREMPPVAAPVVRDSRAPLRATWGVTRMVLATLVMVLCIPAVLPLCSAVAITDGWDVVPDFLSWAWHGLAGREERL